MKSLNAPKPFFILAVIALSAMVMGGCYRQPLKSTPPGNEPVKVVAEAPAPASEQQTEEPTSEMTYEEETVTEEAVVASDEDGTTEAVSETVTTKQVVIEETYEVESDEDDFPRLEEPKESDLAAEPVPAPSEVVAEDADTTATDSVEEVAAVETTESAEPAEPVETLEPVEPIEPVEIAPAPMAAYYVQVGAFSDADAAEGVRETLVNKGYDGSRLVETGGGLFKVQAGPFAEKPAARDALTGLMPEFKDAFIIKAAP